MCPLIHIPSMIMYTKLLNEINNGELDIFYEMWARKIVVAKWRSSTWKYLIRFVLFDVAWNMQW